MSALRRARHAKGLSLERLAKLAGTTPQQVSRLEAWPTGKDSRKLTREWAERLAPHLGVSAQSLVFEDEASAQRRVPLVGYVSAGARASYFAEGQGLADEDVTAPDGATERTVAVEVRGTSLGELFDNWIVYYDDVRDPATPDLIGRLCVCGLANGRIVVKKLARGKTPGHYNLLSNTEAPMVDQIVEWAAPVKQLMPR